MSAYNPIDSNPKLRTLLYQIQWVVNLAMGAVGIVLAATQGGVGDIPPWFVTANLVFNFVWTYTGLTAHANVQQGPTPVQVVTGGDPGSPSVN